MRLTFQRLDVVAWKDPGLAVALSFPPVGLVLGQDHDLVSSLKGQLILVLTGVSVNRTVLLTTWKQDKCSKNSSNPRLTFHNVLILNRPLPAPLVAADALVSADPEAGASFPASSLT